MPADAMLKYLSTTEYAFKYDDEIKSTKREVAKARKAAKLAKQESQNTTTSNDTHVVWNIVEYPHSFTNLVTRHGYRQAYVLVVNQILA